MSNPKIYSLKFVTTIFIVMNLLKEPLHILLRICFLRKKKKQPPATTPPKHVQTLLPEVTSSLGKKINYKST